MDAEDRAGKASGLSAQLRGIVAAFLGLLEIRVELLGSELEEQMLRLGGMFIVALVCLYLVGLAVVLAAAFFVLVFWETYRLEIVAGLSLFSLLAGMVCWRVLNRLFQARPKPFAATLGELAKDRESLGAGP